MSLLPRNAKLLEYKILGHLGSGGFANTYLALDANLNKQVAIKEFFPRSMCERGKDGDDFTVHALPGKEEQFAAYRSFFVREAQTLARFDEKNVVKVLRYFEGLGTAYIIMEFVEGRPLDSYRDDAETLNEDVVSGWLAGILSGLKVLHENGIVHGDIKPKNILIRNDGSPVLIDFGASVTYQGEAPGFDGDVVISQGFAAPEQFRDRTKCDYRIDIFAVGAVFYEIVTRDRYRWADGGDARDVRNYSRYFRQKLLRSIERALATDPNDRYRTAEQWLDELTLNGMQKFGRSIRRHKFAYAAVLALMAGAGYSAHYVVANEIDAHNYGYKLLASEAEVRELVALGQRGEDKIRGAASYLDRYRNEYGQHLSRLDERNFVSGRVNLASLKTALGELETDRAALLGAADAVAGLRQRYYFQYYGPSFAQADAVVERAQARLPGYSRELFAALLENTISRDARARDIPVDAADLAALINQLDGLKGEIPIEEVAIRARPVADEFLGQQYDKTVRRELEKERAAVAAEVEPLYRKYEDWTGGNALKGNLDRIAKAESSAELKELRVAANGIVGRILAQRKAEFAERKRLQFAAVVRSLVRAADAEMIRVDGNSFPMGNDQQDYAQPLHSVRVETFFIAKNEVTNRQWSVCVRAGQCPKLNSPGADDEPVTDVTWDEAQRFVAWMNAAKPSFRYRLPSEAEWEFVVRNYGYRVGELQADISSVTVKNTNKRGINSIMGNALEWLDDCWHGGYVGAPRDGRSWNTGLQCHRRVVRGANWGGKYVLTEANAHFYRPFGVEKGTRDPRIGFRLAGDAR